MWDITRDEMPEAARGWGEEMIEYLPMTKSSVKELDTIEHFMEHEYQARISDQIRLDPIRLLKSGQA